MAEIVTATVVGTFSALVNIAQNLNKIVTSVEVKARVTELYDLVIAGQQRAFEEYVQKQSMANEITDIKEKFANVKAWEETKQRYALYEIEPSVYAYALKKDSGTTEPPHWICTHCYELGKKSILQRGFLKERRVGRNCPACGNVITFFHTEKQPIYV